MGSRVEPSAAVAKWLHYSAIGRTNFLGGQARCSLLVSKVSLNTNRPNSHLAYHIGVHVSLTYKKLS